MNTTAHSATTNPVAAAIESFRVQVNSWMYRRRVEVLPDQVGLQVTVPTCNHCPTCQGRVRTFQQTLREKPDKLHQWKYRGDGATWLFLPRGEQENPLDVLRETLGIRICR